ncbi:thioredoxin domain-containing protein [Exiguobacterium sp. s149]|uniref:thioredoxin domain-containing protein n=1 Tax=Exiguobacterium sp. s149 TaxID=2751224 RepID=UPI00333B07CF
MTVVNNLKLYEFKINTTQLSTNRISVLRETISLKKHTKWTRIYRLTNNVYSCKFKSITNVNEKRGEKMLSKFQLSDLQMVNHSTQPVVLKFTTYWCPGCRQLALLFESVAEGYPDAFSRQEYSQ